MDKKFQQYTKPWIKTETLYAKKKRAARVFSILKKTYPGARMILNYSNNIQLLVAVVLSAQCTDKKVNEVTAVLFKKYKTVKDFANARQSVLEKEIYQTGFYRAKAKNIIGAAKKLEKDFGGKLPRTMAEALTLPGVARKTGNIILGNAYGIVEGMAVDTHVSRISQRLGLTPLYRSVAGQAKEPNPIEIEKDLMELFPKSEWFKLTYRIIEHGRTICTAPKPKCELCPLNNICPSSLV